MTKIRRIYLYRDSEMPEKGWLQSCFLCYAFTSRLDDFKKESCNRGCILNQYLVFICKDCAVKIKNKEIYNKYEKKCEDYIKNIVY